MKTVIVFFLLLLNQSLQQEIIQRPRPANLTIVVNAKPFRDSQSQMATKAIEIYLKKESQLKSYHPHYLTSLSYPYPITPHFYFAEVVGGKTIMYAKDVYDWDPNTISKLAINGVTYEDSSAKYYSFQREQTFKYMLALQIENSYPDSRQSIIHMHNRKDHLLVLTQYENKISAFIICLTRNSSIIPLDVQGIKINLRNQSQGDTKLNWRFSRSLVWKGKNENINPNSINFVGLVLQLQFTDKTVKKDTVLNIYEIESSEKLSLAQFATLQQKLVMSSFLPKTLKIVKRNENCAKAAVQKIFEGLSYQYGTLKIRDSEKIIDNEPKALLSFSPSRKRFPWGFLWDDGFHCEVAVRKDEPLTLKVIKSWLDTMLENGWIPRQQNRGIERQQLCNCPRFMQKDIKDGNPPTLLLALQYLRKQKKLNPNVFQLQYWDKIKRWYGWFMRSQRNQNSYLFKWKDSINQMGASFTSGMDDFPRPINCKAHVDLQSWMFFFANFMAQTAPIYSQDNSEYVNDLKMIKQGFKFFIEDKTKLYKDISVDGFSQHFGYPNILPIAFGIPQFKSEEYNATLAFIIANLDIDAGLASISKRSSLYLQNADAYWKGPVWLNLNYLFLRGLKLYYPKDDRLYKKVRANLLQTVCGNWQKSGYFYQNYIQGRGSFSFPFNGWTSVISIIEQQTY